MFTLRFNIKIFISGGKTPDVGSRTYTEIMKEQYLRAEETEVSHLFRTSKKLGIINFYNMAQW